MAFSIISSHSLKPAALVLFMFALTQWLGFWQLDRARQKDDIIAAFELGTRLPPVPLEQITKDGEQTRFRAVIADGEYDSEHQLLLDNQVEQGRVGYHVYTPYRTATGEAILVNRGWVALPDQLRNLPSIDITNSRVPVAGRLSQPANPAIKLGELKLEDGWPKIVQFIEYGVISEVLGYSLRESVILLSPEAAQGYERNWSERVTTMGPDRHRGYALTWFSLSATLLIMVGIFIWRGRKLRSEEN